MKSEKYVLKVGSNLTVFEFISEGPKKKRDFYLYGQVGDDFPVFELGREYDGFLAKRKIY